MLPLLKCARAAGVQQSVIKRQENVLFFIMRSMFSLLKLLTLCTKNLYMNIKIFSDGHNFAL